MGIGSRAITVGGLAFAAALVVGCGTSQIKGALSQGANSTISGDLSAVSDAVSDGSCARAHSALAMLDATLSRLPSDTNAQLMKNLTQGASTVRTLAVKECRGASTPTTNASSSTSNSSSTSAVSSSTPTTPTTISSPTTAVTTTQTVTHSQSPTTPGTGSVTQLGSGSGSNTSATNGGGGLAGGQ
jgi:cell wall integrity and stress response component